MLDVLKTTKYVVKNSWSVAINREKINELAEVWSRQKINIPKWDLRYHFFDNTEKTCEYLFILDSINFCFWAKEENDKWKIDDNGVKISGYNALALALKRVFERGKNFSVRKIKFSDFKEIFRGENEIPLIKERFNILRENYRILESKYGGNFTYLIEKCNYDSLKILSELIDNFPSFKDEAEYGGRKIAFYKRAQILVGDIFCSFGGRKWGNLKNLDKITVFADYKIPQILRGYGILEYRKELGEKIDSKILIASGSKEEVEIRANTIWAGEFIKEALKKRGVNLKSIEIDWVLWNLSKFGNLNLKPHHLTKTIFY